MHIHIRRMALLSAAMSVGLLFALLLGFSACFSSPGQPTEPLITQDAVSAQSQSLLFPYRVGGTALSIRNMAGYDGPFYEDGSGREVMDVAAILLQNTGDRMVSLAKIRLITEKDVYEFEGMLLPPYTSALIPEKSGKSYITEPILSCEGIALYADPMAAYPITVSPMDIGTLRLTNISDEPLSDIHIFHKTYLKESDLYVGGVAFETVIDYIAPRSFTEVRPRVYAADYSELVYIQ